MDLKGIMPSETSQTKINPLFFTYMWNQKNKINEYNKTEMDSQTYRTN